MPLLFLVLLAVSLPGPSLDQLIGAGVCPIGFQLGGVCTVGQCLTLSLPRYECLNGVCCRDLRPLPQRLQPPVYATSGTCVDRALNCALFTRHCRLGCYRRCMQRHCPASCGFCGAGIGGGTTGGLLTPINGIGLAGSAG